MNYLFIGYDSVPHEIIADDFRDALLDFADYIGENKNKLMKKAISATETQQEGISMFNHFVSFGRIEKVYVFSECFTEEEW